MTQTMRVPASPFLEPVASREIYRNPWMVLREDDIRRPDGSRGIYAVVARGIDAVGNVEKPVRGSRAKARHNHNHYVFKVR